jgi:hypothetical protein
LGVQDADKGDAVVKVLKMGFPLVVLVGGADNV